MFTSPFDSTVGFAAFDSETCGIPAIHPDEAALIPARSVASAHLSLQLGRHAAHEALACAGLQSDVPILRNPDRSPRWPSGAVGSISHTRRDGLTVAVAVAARSESVQSLGVDIENARRKISEGFIKRVCTARERAWIDEDRELRFRRALQLFSAKETLFKLFAPIFDGPKTFQGAESSYDAASRSFEVVLTPFISDRYPAFSRHIVHVREDQDFILTAAILKH